MSDAPEVLCLSETWLDQSVKEVPIEDYVCVARRDRVVGKCGGVAIYAHRRVAQQVTNLGDSKTAERHWVVLHTEQGPLLLGNSYRPPGEDLSTIQSLEEEWSHYSDTALRRILVGDLNVHQVSLAAPFATRYARREDLEGTNRGFWIEATGAGTYTRG